MMVLLVLEKLQLFLYMGTDNKIIAEEEVCQSFYYSMAQFHCLKLPLASWLNIYSYPPQQGAQAEVAQVGDHHALDSVARPAHKEKLPQFEAAGTDGESHREKEWV